MLEKNISLSLGDFNWNCLHWEAINLREKPLVLIHGYSAHAYWWEHIAPVFAENRNVYAIDLFGMGDSDYVSEYNVAVWSEQLRTLADYIGEKFDIVAHSMGAAVALYFVTEYIDVHSNLIILDAVPLRTPERIKKTGSMPDRREVSYDSLEQAVAYYRLIPNQPVVNPAIVKAIAKKSYKQIGEKWVLKTDPQLPSKMKIYDPTDRFINYKGKIGWICGKLTTVCDQESIDYSLYMMRGLLQPAWIEGAFHHLFIDKPELTIQAIYKVLDQLNEENES